MTLTDVTTTRAEVIISLTSAQVIEMSVNVVTYSPSQDYTHPDNHTSPTYNMTLGFKPFAVKTNTKSYFVHKRHCTLQHVSITLETTCRIVKTVYEGSRTDAKFIFCC